MFADVGKEANLNKDGLTSAEMQSWKSTRAWLMGQAQTLRAPKRRRAEDQAAEPRLRESRPDAVLVEMRPGRSMAADTAQQAAAAVHIVELKYCSDTRWQDRQAEAQEQHRELVQALRNRGLQVHLHTILLGTAGSIYNQMQEQMKQLGLCRDQTMQLG